MSANEVAIQQPPGTLVLTSDGVTERYSMSEVPADSSSLVRTAYKSTLDDLDLTVLIKNLDRAIDLLYVAYVGTAGTVVRAEISDCQVELLRLCQKSSLTMGEFYLRSGDVLQALVRCFAELMAGDEEAALDYLAECATSARGMAEASRQLAGEFSALKDKTQSSHNKTLVAVAVQKDEKDTLERVRNEMKDSLVRQEQRREDLKKKIEELQTMIEELKADEQKQSDRENTLAIVSCISGAIGQGLGGFAATMRAASPAGVASAVVANRTTQ